uniref:uncharacterized protein n=2 Tax=Myxine glutinosa TaxID=7769 RepID=UPI00358E802D
MSETSQCHTSMAIGMTLKALHGLLNNVVFVKPNVTPSQNNIKPQDEVHLSPWPCALEDLKTGMEAEERRRRYRAVGKSRRPCASLRPNLPSTSSSEAPETSASGVATRPAHRRVPTPRPSYSSCETLKASETSAWVAPELGLPENDSYDAAVFSSNELSQDLSPAQSLSDQSLDSDSNEFAAGPDSSLPPSPTLGPLDSPPGNYSEEGTRRREAYLTERAPSTLTLTESELGGSERNGKAVVCGVGGSMGRAVFKMGNILRLRKANEVYNSNFR